jgi:hypothetical protein
VTILDYPRVLADAGLVAVQYPRWRERGRPYPFAPFGALIHDDIIGPADPRTVDSTHEGVRSRWMRPDGHPCTGYVQPALPSLEPARRPIGPNHRGPVLRDRRVQCGRLPLSTPGPPHVPTPLRELEQVRRPACRQAVDSRSSADRPILGQGREDGFLLAVDGLDLVGRVPEVQASGRNASTSVLVRDVRRPDSRRSASGSPLSGAPLREPRASGAGDVVGEHTPRRVSRCEERASRVLSPRSPTVGSESTRERRSPSLPFLRPRQSASTEGCLPELTPEAK